MWKKTLIVAVLLGFFVSPAYAALPEDFSCKGVALGANADKMREVFGEALFDREILVQGNLVRYYEFPRGFTVGISSRTGNIIDFKIRNQEYRMRGGIRYGATAYQIEKIFGKAKRIFLDGKTCYRYFDDEDRRRSIVLEVDSMTHQLLSMRITSIPLTENERADWGIEDATDVSRELEDIFMEEKTIDLSAISQETGRAK